jgi:hypothetical protein
LAKYELVEQLREKEGWVLDLQKHFLEIVERASTGS